MTQIIDDDAEKRRGAEAGKDAKGNGTSVRMRGLRLRWFSRDNLIILILAGILLFVIALPTEESDGAEEILGVNGGNAFAAGAVSNPAGEAGMEETGRLPPENEESPGTGEETLVDYAAAQEEKLARLLSGMEGVGEVEVMLTFVSSEELVVEKDAPVTRSNTAERDSEGGTRTVTQYEQGDSTVYMSGSGESEPYVIKTLNPRVEGVVVVAQGAGDGTVNRNITEIAQALYGVEAHKVKVVPMRAQNSGSAAQSTAGGTTGGMSGGTAGGMAGGTAKGTAVSTAMGRENGS